LCSSYSNSQTTSSQPVDGTTGSLTNFTGRATDTTSVWNNAGSVGQPLTCWAGGDPGYCGPNPRVSAWGAGSNIINFSYGQVDLNQVVNINKALAIGGSGVQLSGFNFGFQAKNGNGWDDGRQDYLGAYVKFYNSGGGLAANYDYTSQTNKRYNWTNFNFSETFSSPVPATNFSNAQYGFIGKDNNFWVGPYGPEITNVSFSLKYTVKPDPCIADPLSSPTCPGYALATVKNTILGSTVSNASATSFVPAINYTLPAAVASPAMSDPVSALIQQGPVPQQGLNPQQGPLPQQGLNPQQGPGPAQDPNQNPIAQNNPTQPGTQQAPGPAPTQPQPAGGPPQVAQQSAPPPSSGGPAPSGGGPAKNNDGPKMSTSQALSIVKSVQEKDKAVQQMAVQNAAKVVEGSTQQSQATGVSALTSLNDMSASSAASAAAFSSQTTQNSMQVATQMGQPQQTTQSSSQTNQYNSGTGLTFNNSSFGFNSSSFSMSLNNNQQTQIVTLQQPRVTMKQTEVETPTQVSSFSGLSRAGNPLSEMMMQQRFEMMQSNVEQRGPSVNKNVQPNDLAGGVDVASMATQPKGFELYSFMIKDSTFYPPKEVYKNQKVVDNVMVLRQMSSDRLHKEMVDSQYKEK